MEIRRPLRRSTEPKLRRNARNFAVAGISAITLQLVERPVVVPLARLVESRRWGLLKRLPLPAWVEIPLAAVLLDYTLYLWHVATHRVDFLWRFHRVHHVDLDMDASTALRFHFGELALSTVLRAAQVVGFGVSPRALSIWQTALLLEILFHHSNVELPAALERRLACWIVTPRLHGIHHSTVAGEMDSNWSSGLTVWDRLHGTFRGRSAEIEIGLPEIRDPRDVTLPKILAMPFAATPAAASLCTNIPGPGEAAGIAPRPFARNGSGC